MGDAELERYCNPRSSYSYSNCSKGAIVIKRNSLFQIAKHCNLWKQFETIRVRAVKAFTSRSIDPVASPSVISDMALKVFRLLTSQVHPDIRYRSAVFLSSTATFISSP